MLYKLYYVLIYLQVMLCQCLNINLFVGYMCYISYVLIYL